MPVRTTPASTAIVVISGLLAPAVAATGTSRATGLPLRAMTVTSCSSPLEHANPWESAQYPK